jgi:hypothetical protein
MGTGYLLKCRFLRCYSELCDRFAEQAWFDKEEVPMVRLDLEKWKQTADDLRRLATEAPHARTRERFMTLFLMVSQNLCSTAAARQIGREDETVLQWVRIYNAQGPEALTWRHTGGRRPFCHQMIRNKSSTRFSKPSRRTMISRDVDGH